jgi:arylsulfatase A-like enzyme
MRPSRREFLGGAAAAAVGMAAARKASGQASAQPRPNIVVLLADDLRHDTIAALGNREIQTPNLDRLVNRGTAFTQATIMGGLQGAICVPSRAMFHTGRHLFHLEGDGQRIPPAMISLPEVLRAGGYQTHAVGKWHNDKASLNRAYAGGSRIFLGGMHSPYAARLHDYDGAGEYAPASAKDFTGTHATEVFTDAAVEFLTRSHDAPFFLYVAFTAPHDPREAPEAFRKRYDPARLSVPPNLLPRHPFDNGELAIRDEQLAPWPRTPEIIQQHTADYYACISHLDAQVGRILDTLDAQALSANTIVVFAGDNGLAVGQHGLMGKQNLYEHSIRVPLLMAGPGIAASSKCDAPCYLHDLFPTLCEAIDLPLPPSVESTSLWPCIGNPACRPHNATFHAYRDVQRAVRTGQHKLIQYAVNGEVRTQLFDLGADPWELNDLAEAQPELRAELEALLQQWRETVEFHQAPS